MLLRGYLGNISDLICVTITYMCVISICAMSSNFEVQSTTIHDLVNLVFINWENHRPTTIRPDTDDNNYW